MMNLNEKATLLNAKIREQYPETTDEKGGNLQQLVDALYGVSV